jgi:hypothetical protein
MMNVDVSALVMRNVYIERNSEWESSVLSESNSLIFFIILAYTYKNIIHLNKYFRILCVQFLIVCFCYKELIISDRIFISKQFFFLI